MMTKYIFHYDNRDKIDNNLNMDEDNRNKYDENQYRMMIFNILYDITTRHNKYD